MKQKQIVNAYKALSNMYKMQLPVREAHAVYMVRRQLEDQYYFQLEQERTLLEQHHGTINRDGDIRFGSKEDAQAFQAAITEMNDMDIDIEVSPAHIQFERVEDIKVTPEDMERLEGFIIFE